MADIKDRLHKIIYDLLREEFKDMSEEDFNKFMEEGKLLAEQAGFTFKTPTETLKEHIADYNKWSSTK